MHDSCTGVPLGLAHPPSASDVRDLPAIHLYPEAIPKPCAKNLGQTSGLSRYDEDDDAFDEGSHDSALNKHRPSADLRVAADMESIGQEYHGKRVSRKNLGTTVAGE